MFILVEGALLYVVFRYRRRENQGTPPQTHGSTKLEIAWTLIPAVILVFIAVPTVRTIFITQAQAAPGSLNIDVTGHQWWWEFRYPEYGVTTANEIYLPVGRTVNFRLRSADVIHSFWTPQLGGKRDVVTNRTNYLWYTPDSSTASSVWNGFCVEYCGASHANMHFRVFTVTPQQFDSWVAGQKMPARFGAVAGPPTPAGGPIPPPREAAGMTVPTGTTGPSRTAQAAVAQPSAWSAQEQQDVTAEGDAIKLELAKANREYEHRFNHIFIVCATGKSATEILKILRNRLRNDAGTELHEAAEQQQLITHIRLKKWLSE